MLVLATHGTAQTVGYILLAALVVTCWLVVVKVVADFIQRRFAKRFAKLS
jgi:hypothetical protein